MTNSTQTTVIIGGNGKTGRRVADRLRAQGRKTRLVSRSTAVPFDWNKPETWEPALRGAQSVYLTYYPDLAAPGSAEQVSGVSQAAVRVGVEKIVMLAGRGEPQVHPAEDAVRACGARYTILECSFFNQNFDEGLLGPVEGMVVFPGGETREPFIDCDDIADVAVAALTESGHDGKTYELTGPRLLTFGEAVAAMTEASGQDLRYVPVSFEEYSKILVQHMSPAEVEFLIELFRELLDGHNASVTDDVRKVLGRPAKDFKDYAREAAEAWK